MNLMVHLSADESRQDNQGKCLPYLFRDDVKILEWVKVRGVNGTMRASPKASAHEPVGQGFISWMTARAFGTKI